MTWAARTVCSHSDIVCSLIQSNFCWIAMNLKYFIMGCVFFDYSLPKPRLLKQIAQVAHSNMYIPMTWTRVAKRFPFLGPRTVILLDRRMKKPLLALLWQPVYIFFKNAYSEIANFHNIWPSINFIKMCINYYRVTCYFKLPPVTNFVWFIFHWKTYVSRQCFKVSNVCRTIT
jgi:hypothetical protein